MKAKKLSNDQLLRKAMGISKGGNMAFTLKSNAEKFAAIVKSLGFKPRGLRSSGPTVDGKVVDKAYLVMW